MKRFFSYLMIPAVAVSLSLAPAMMAQEKKEEEKKGEKKAKKGKKKGTEGEKKDK